MPGNVLRNNTLPDGEDNSIIQVIGSHNTVVDNRQVEAGHSFSVFGSDNQVTDNEADYFFVRALCAPGRIVPCAFAGRRR